MKTVFTVLLIASFYSAFSQEFQSVDHFNKVLVGPHIELILEEGEHETVTLSNLRIDDRKVNVKVSGNTLVIYLDDARITTKHRKTYEDGYKKKVPVYKGTMATATVSYNYLSKLSLRGEEHHEVKTILDADKMKVKMYGEGELFISSIQSDALKVKLYGANLIRIKNGSVRKQKYKSYGENVIDCESLRSVIAKTSNFGESKIKIHATEKIKFSALGESRFNIVGSHG